MRRKSSSPALYELIRARQAPPAPMAAEDEEAAEAPAEPSLRWLSPGRTIRLPVGYLLLATAALILCLSVAYVVGHSRGERLARAEYEQQWLADHEVAWPVPPPERPLRSEPQTGSRGSIPAPVGGEDVPHPQPLSQGERGEEGWGPILSDPRRPGHNYFVLIHTKRENAVELARFCRDRGVEAYVVAVKNVSLYRVIVLPGYVRGERDSEQVRDLERRIVEVARKWKLQVNPRDDLAYYPEKFEG